ncbi:hypothetical protein AERO_14875 [Aeromicrobium fastidiosum]|uniref:hypothetical protein n=1 Tax=Aeromicrobium fastidiosum TaxID=52699 RepID=UPI0020231C81|nr:hypothetical protein [Aeromicrobium fastidiosum]MCL8252672.1 hypothetical protein [Aeromicrobium fastidiosum]
MATDFKSIGKYDQGALISGGLALILSFISSYVTASFDGPGGLSISDGTNAWTSYATLGILLVIVATAIVAVKAFARENLPDGVPWNLAAAALAGVGTLLLILRAVFPGGPDAAGYSIGPGWSGYLLFLAGIALTVFTVLSFRASGEKLPQANKNNNNGGTTPPAAPPAA